MLEAHKKRCGIKDDDITSTDDLDALYARLPPKEELE